ncbi:Protein lin-54 homolog [Geodia barretti]|uniref:Protein lin-54 homolog n=1 Tax=Geodia barretti TaxID=519541 RepID=A0AA35TKD6_GEOBA|nr:Protein lin-54 homolog [Geodia barretti]
MSDEVVGDVCELLEVIETEQVVEILEHTQFLDLAAPMETRGEMPAGGCSDFCEVPAEERQLAGQKRKRVEVRGDLEEAGVFGASLPTAVVPPSPRQVLATPLSLRPKPHSSTPHQTSENTTTLHLQNTDPANPSPLLPAVNIQLTSEELQALFGILQQRGSTPNPSSSSSATSSQAQTHHKHYQPVAPKKMVTAVVIPSSASSSATSTTSSVSLSSTGIMEAQAVAAAKASVTGKKRQCSCKNSQCLKLYCDCFSHEEWCGIDCSCRNCRNNPAFSQLRELTLKVYITPLF